MGLREKTGLWGVGPGEEGKKYTLLFITREDIYSKFFSFLFCACDDGELGSVAPW